MQFEFTRDEAEKILTAILLHKKYRVEGYDEIVAKLVKELDST